jgi:hypothetical protein
MHAAPVADGSGFNAPAAPAADNAGANVAENDRCVPILPNLTGMGRAASVAQVDGCQQVPASETICTSGAETARRCISRQARSDGDGPASRELTDEYGVHSTEYGVPNAEL